jgi:hypothetical protein
MQPKVALEGIVHSTTEYRIVVTCNKCAGLHEMGISVPMENGPVDKQSIGNLYDGKGLPKSLASLSSTSISCPKTGRQSTQKNLHQIFLVPPTNEPPKRHPKSGAATSLKF